MTIEFREADSDEEGAEGSDDENAMEGIQFDEDDEDIGKYFQISVHLRGVVSADHVSNPE